MRVPTLDAGSFAPKVSARGGSRVEEHRLCATEDVLEDRKKDAPRFDVGGLDACVPADKLHRGVVGVAGAAWAITSLMISTESLRAQSNRNRWIARCSASGSDEACKRASVDTRSRRRSEGQPPPHCESFCVRCGVTNKRAIVARPNEFVCLGRRRNLHRNGNPDVAHRRSCL